MNQRDTSDGGLDVDAGDDDPHEQGQQCHDDGVGHDFEGCAGHRAVLMQVRLRRFVAMSHRAQLVLHAGRLLSGGCGRLGLIFLDYRLQQLLDDRWLLLDNGLGLHRFEGGLQVSTAIGAETDAARQLLAATVTKPGNIVSGGFCTGSVPIRRVGVVAHHKAVAVIKAHGKALGTHDLTVVYHKFLLGHRHDFTTLWTLEFHKKIDLKWLQR